jgi:hypothetical protein
MSSEFTDLASDERIAKAAAALERNGIRPLLAATGADARELTREQVGREFFAAHTVSELAGWTDYDLEAAGRLSEPVRYDPASDRYVPVS